MTTELAIGFAENPDTGEITTVPRDDAVNGHGTHVTSTIIGYNYRGTPMAEWRLWQESSQ